MAYLAGRYPALQWGQPSALRLDGVWLVEVFAGGEIGGAAWADDEPQVRALVMVGPEGSVEEVGTGSLSRRSAHKGLASLYGEKAGLSRIDS